jgi:hypothetical protein
MVTSKLSAIWRIIRCKQYSVITSHKTGVHYVNDIATDLATAITIALALKTNYNNLIAHLEAQATEAGDLHYMEALKEAVERINS